MSRSATLALLAIVGSAPAAGAEQDSAPGTASNPRTQAVIGVEMQSLSSHRGTWRHASFEIIRETTTGRVWSASIHDVTRFSLRDDTLEVGYAQRVSKRATGFASLGGSLSHQVVPHLTLAAGIESGIARGWVIGGSVGHRRYDAGAVNVFKADVDRYVAAFRLSYSAFVGQVPGHGASLSHVARVDRLYGADERNLLGLIVSAGRELEQDVRDGLMTSRVRGVSLTGRHWLTPTVGFVYSAHAQEQGALYTRRGGSAGLICRF